MMSKLRKFLTHIFLLTAFQLHSIVVCVLQTNFPIWIPFHPRYRPTFSNMTLRLPVPMSIAISGREMAFELIYTRLKPAATNLPPPHG